MDINITRTRSGFAARITRTVDGEYGPALAEFVSERQRLSDRRWVRACAESFCRRNAVGGFRTFDQTGI